jgi:hypothetical protein
VSLRRVDARLTLPRPVRRACVLGGLDAWRSGLELAGAELVDRAGAPELTVAPASLAAEAAATGAAAVLLEGRGASRTLARLGYAVRRLLPLPDLDRPDLLLPLDREAPARYALARWRPAEGALKQVRNRVVVEAVRRGALPDVRPLQIIGLRDEGPPFPLGAAAELGVPSNGSWFLTLGQGDALTRAVFHVFVRGAEDPGWVVKVARVPGYSAPFERDERGIGLARAAGVRVAEHVPVLLGRLEAGGLQGSVETAAVGERLSTLLRRGGSRDAGLALVERIAGWLLAVARETASAPGALECERERLRDHVVAPWIDRGAPPELVERVPAVPGVLVHDDLGAWNVVGDERSFTVLDWESARRHGLPLWDLLYFLVDALAQLDGAWSDEERVRHALALLRGELVSSPLLFAWVRQAAEEARIPNEGVGPIATLCWLHHGLSHLSRREAAVGAGTVAGERIPPVERIAPTWLADPLLGPGWSRWLP